MVVVVVVVEEEEEEEDDDDDDDEGEMVSVPPSTRAQIDPPSDAEEQWVNEHPWMRREEQGERDTYKHPPAPEGEEQESKSESEMTQGMVSG